MEDTALMVWVPSRYF